MEPEYEEMDTSDFDQTVNIFLRKVQPMIQKKHQEEFQRLKTKFCNQFSNFQMDKEPSTLLRGCSQEMSSGSAEELDIDKIQNKRTSRQKESNITKESLQKTACSFNKPSVVVENHTLKDLVHSINSELTLIKKKEGELKEYYFKVGKLLHYAKQYCINGGLDFMDFVKKHLVAKSSTQINVYIKFYLCCREYECLLFNCYSATFIVKNFKEIKKLLSYLTSNGINNSLSE